MSATTPAGPDHDGHRWDALADAVRERRERLGLAQLAVAARGGPSDTSLTQIETGTWRSHRPASTCRKLDTGLDWPPGTALATLLGDPRPADPDAAAPYPRGTVWSWPAMVLPPDGWAFLPQHALQMSNATLAIVALRDHLRPPALDLDDDAQERLVAGAADSRQQKLLDGRRAAEQREAAAAAELERVREQANRAWYLRRGRG